jgi:ABC-type nitrate/sulfonate/bicarbonate transport system permease component
MTDQIWTNLDLIKVSVASAAIGFFLGLVIGYQLGFEPVVNTFKPLIG